MGGKKDSRFKNWFLVCSILCIFSLTLVGPVFAQDQGPDEFTLEEITVTAEKRESELQKIPMSISVLRMDQMRQLNVNQVYDLQKVLPDVSAQAQVGTFVLVSIRDVETNMFNPLFETTVSTHLDGIQLTRAGGMENFFFDLERVEVLKGPQGTLYGRGSTAGSINMITKKPVLGEFGGFISEEVGNYSRYRTDAALNIPIVDKLAMRLAARINKFGGYSDSGYGDADSWSGRSSLRWEPNDRTTVDLMADYVKSNNNGYSMFGDEGYHMTTYGNLTIVPQTSETVVDPDYQSGGPLIAPWTSKWAFGDSLADNWNNFKQYGITFKLAYDFDFATMSVDYGYRSQHEKKSFIWGGAYLYPSPFTPGIPPFGADDPSVGDTISIPYTQVAVRVRNPSLFTNPTSSSFTNTLELRLTSKSTIAAGDKFEWIAGVMGQRDTVTETVNMEYWGYFAQIKTETEGAFAQVSWMPIDKWNITGGIRENWDKKKYWGINPYPTDPVTFLPISDTANYNRESKDWTATTYRANISYIPNNDIMPYLTYARGYRAGNIDYGGQPVPPEFLDSYELGLKSRWLNNRLQVNTGIYYYDYKDYNNWTGVNKCWRDTTNDPARGYYPGDHYCDDVGSNPSQGGHVYNPADPGVTYPDGVIDTYDYEYNIGYVGYSPGGAIQKGISLNVEYLPSMADIVSFNITWRKNEYGDPYNARAALLAIYPDADSPYRDQVDMSGKEFALSPPVRGNISYTHSWYFGSDTLAVSPTIFYEGKRIDEYVNEGWPNEYKMPGADSYITADLSVNYTSSRWMPAGVSWNIRATVNNMFDNDALSDITYSDDILFGTKDVYELGSGIATGKYINPRTYSIALQINF